MKNHLLRFYFALLFSAVPLGALADTASTGNSSSGRIDAQIADQNKGPVGSPVSNSANPTDAANQKQVPKLAIEWSCKTCENNEKVAPLLETSYAEEAAKNGYLISPTETAEVVITEFTQRPPGARVMLGILAGKDRLGVHVKYRGKEFTAYDYSANAWFGMNSLCESVAKQSYEKLVSISQSEKPPQNEVKK